MNMYNASLAAISSGSGESFTEVATITDSQVNYSDSITIPELIGAKYFMIIGNYLSSLQTSNLYYIDDNDIIHTLIYMDGKVLAYYPSLGSGTKSSEFSCAEDISNSFSFNENTGEISLLNYSYFFSRYTVDDTDGDTVYTIYRLG